MINITKILSIVIVCSLMLGLGVNSAKSQSAQGVKMAAYQPPASPRST